MGMLSGLIKLLFLILIFSLVIYDNISLNELYGGYWRCISYLIVCFWLIIWCDWFGFCSEEEARMKIYSVSTRHYFAFGALVSEELSYKIKGICVVVFNLRVLFMFCASEFFLKKNLVFVFLELQNCLEFGGCFLILT